MSKPERIFTGNVNIDTTKAISVNDFNLLKAKGVIKVEKKSKRHLESELQQACVTWFRLQHPTKLLFAIPNGGQRSKVEAKIMMGEGVVPGVADLQLLFGNGQYFSLFIEMKAGKNTQTDDQKEFQAYCDRNKFKYVVCKSVDEFINEVNDYLN